MRRIVTLFIALAVLGCDRVRWHRFIVSDPVPDTLHVQYSNIDCQPFPIIEGMVVIEYDQQGCACTSTPESGAKWGPNAFSKRNSDGSLELLEDIRVVGGGTSYYDDILQITTKVLRNAERPERRLDSFLEQCSHLPNVSELSLNESIIRRLESRF